MPVDVLAGFVDREPELILFRRMLAGETNKRILRILEGAERGKTCFLLRLVQECEEQGMPVAPLDFDQRRRGLTDYLGVAQAIRRYLGDDRTSHICACEDVIAHPGPLVSIRTGEGDAGMDWGERVRFAGTDISDVAARDLIRFGDVSAGPPTPAQQVQQQTEMGRALCRDLATLDRVVLLIDTFEHASADVCAWLERWLFEPLRRELSRVLLVVAGRPECRPFFEPPRLWGSLVDTIDRFTPLSDEHILDHYRQRGLTVSSEEVSLIMIARTSPGRMAQVGDWLEQTRGGAR